MNELQAIKVSDRIREEAPYLRERMKVHKMGNGEYTIRIRMSTDQTQDNKPFYVWDMENWREVRWNFGVRERVEAEV